jgi:hypothetical protein
MPNRGNVTATLTSQGQEYTIPDGYHGGGGKVTANITNLSAANIKYGATVGGVAGTFSQTGSGATAAQILSGRVAFVNGAQVTGTMANRAGDTAALSSVVSGTTLKLLASAGYRDGVDDYVTITDSDFVSSNIRNGVNLFGVVGTLSPKLYASGMKSVGPPAESFIELYDLTEPAWPCEVTGLAFKPRVIIIYPNGGVPGNDAGFVTLYTEYPTGYREPGHGPETSNIVMVSRYYSSNWRFIRLTGNVYVNATGFRLPVKTTDPQIVCWEAWA